MTALIFIVGIIMCAILHEIVIRYIVYRKTIRPAGGIADELSSDLGETLGPVIEACFETGEREKIIAVCWMCDAGMHDNYLIYRKVLGSKWARGRSITYRARSVVGHDRMLNTTYNGEKRF